jgi:hypothetical protein
MQRHSEPLSIDTELDQISSPKRHVGIEQGLLRDIANRMTSSGSGSPVNPNYAGVWPLKPEYDAKECRFPSSVGADETGELSGSQLERDLLKNLSAGEPDVDVVEAKHLASGVSRFGRHSFTVDVLLANAFSIAWTSASIHDW